MTRATADKLTQFAGAAKAAGQVIAWAVLAVAFIVTIRGDASSAAAGVQDLDGRVRALETEGSPPYRATDAALREFIGKAEKQWEVEQRFREDVREQLGALNAKVAAAAGTVANK